MPDLIGKNIDERCGHVQRMRLQQNPWTGAVILYSALLGEVVSAGELADYVSWKTGQCNAED
jgi:hypothetical protein